MGGLVPGEIVSINSPDNSVQVRIFGYHDGVENEKLPWIKVLGQHSGLAGATSTHPYYPKSRVMLSTSGAEFFVVGSLTGYDSDKAQADPNNADNSDNTDPNIPYQTRGPQGQGNRSVPAGQGSDQTSKGTRNVTKTDQPYSKDEPQKIFDYAKQIAPFTMGKQSKFPDLKSIGIPLLSKGSNVLDTIDSMDGNVSGAIKASTKIIKNMEQGGFGDALSLLNGGGGGGGAASQGTAQVADSFGNISLQALLQALLALLAAYALVRAASVSTASADLATVPIALGYSTFQVDAETQTAVLDDVAALDTSVGTTKTALVAQLQDDFQAGFNQAIPNAIAYINGIVTQAGTAAILVQGTTDQESLNSLLSSLQSAASAAGLPASAITAIGGGQVGQLITGGMSAVQSLMAQASGALAQIQSMAQNMNTFGSEINAMSEIMGGPASVQETLTGITQKWMKKKPNFDIRGFTK